MSLPDRDLIPSARAHCQNGGVHQQSFLASFSTPTSCNDNVSLLSLAAVKHDTANTRNFDLIKVDNPLSPLHWDAASLNLTKQHIEKLDASLHETDVRALAALRVIIELWWART